MTDILHQLSSALSERYAIERELGFGGMATVYLAHDVKHDRKVAVKVLRPELAAVLGTERFLNEIKVTANLSHPHILPLLDSGKADSRTVGQADSGGPGEFLFYVMPFVEGESLREKLSREKQLSVEESLEITKAVASALEYAHRRDVIHRDVKPENILMHEGFAMVADFGIALAVRAAGGERLTETGLSLGTPAYMSPEQVAGDRDIDGRSDTYSLACVLYEMLAGDPPFVASNPQAVLARHVTDPAPPIATVRPSVPQPVAAAIAKAVLETRILEVLSATGTCGKGACVHRSRVGKRCLAARARRHIADTEPAPAERLFLAADQAKGFVGRKGLPPAVAAGGAGFFCRFLA